MHGDVALPIKLGQLGASPSASEAWADRASTSMEIVWSLRDEEHTLRCSHHRPQSRSLALAAQCRCMAVCANCCAS